MVTTTELAHVPGADDAGVTRLAIADGAVLQSAEDDPERLAG